MGLFSKKITTVSTASMHLADASVNPMIDAIIYAIASNTGLVENILKTILNGLGVKMRRAYNYARDEYTLGLPSGVSSAIIPVDDDILQGIISNEISHPDGVVINVNAVVAMTPALAVVEQLTISRGYDIQSNTISIYPDGLVFDAMCMEYECDSYGFNCTCVDWAENPGSHRVTIGQIDLSDDGLYVTITYILWSMHTVITGYKTVPGAPGDPDIEVPVYGSEWQEDVNTFQEDIYLDKTDYVYDASYVYATYQKLDPLGTPLGIIYTWLYYIDSGIYPELDSIDTDQPNDTFLPIVPIRKHNVDYTDVSREELPLYITSEKYLKKLDMSFTELGDKVNANPDVAEMDHAYVMFGVNLQTDISASLWYLGLFFSHLYDLQTLSKIDFFTSLSDPNTINQSFNSYETDIGGGVNVSEEELRLNLDYSYIDESINVGNFGRVGTARKSFVLRERMYGAINVFSSFGIINEADLIIEMQITPRTIRRILVVGLELKNTIYRGRYVTVTPYDVATDPEENNLIIPIQYNLAQSMRILQRNALYADGALMVVNTYQVTKLKWYERGWFRVVLMIVAVIITIWTGQAWVGGLVAALEAGVAAFVLYLVSSFLVSVIINMAVDWIVTEFGDKIGFIGALVLMVVSMVFDKTGSGTMIILNSTLSTAQIMMQASLALISSVNEFLVEEGKKIVDQYIDFQTNMEDRWEDLKTAQELLNNEHDINPLMFTSPARLTMVPSESPDGFIQRCIQLPENSVYTIHDQISNFADRIFEPNKNVSSDLYSQNIYV